MSVHLELQIKLLEQERVELRGEIIKLKLDKQELEKQLNLCGVSQQRELLKVLEYTRQIKNNPKDIQLIVDKLYVENL